MLKCFLFVLTTSYISKVPIINNNAKRNHALSELFYRVKNLIRCSNDKYTVFWLKQEKNWVTIILIDKALLVLCFVM